MSEETKILWTMDPESIRWQRCAICNEQKQRIVHEPGKPDFALCDHCHAAFVLEDGGKMRMMYGRIPEKMKETRQFALKQWQRYMDICTYAQREREGAKKEDFVPEVLKPEAVPLYLKHGSAMDAYLALQAEQSEILYDRAKKLEPPPRRLRETGELPNLDDLFKDHE